MPLLWRQGTQFAEGAGDGTPAIVRETAKLLHGATDPLPLFRCKVFHSLGAVQDMLPLLRGHVVELSEAITHALLHLWGEIAEARLMLEGTLLLRRRQVAVVIEPLREMFLPGTRSELLRVAPLLLWVAAAALTVGRVTLPVAPGSQRRQAEDAQKQTAGCSGKRASDCGNTAHLAWR